MIAGVGSETYGFSAIKMQLLHRFTQPDVNSHVARNIRHFFTDRCTTSCRMKDPVLVFQKSKDCEQTGTLKR